MVMETPGTFFCVVQEKPKEQRPIFWGATLEKTLIRWSSLDLFGLLPVRYTCRGTWTCPCGLAGFERAPGHSDFNRPFSTGGHRCPFEFVLVENPEGSGLPGGSINCQGNPSIFPKKIPMAGRLGRIGVGRATLPSNMEPNFRAEDDAPKGTDANPTAPPMDSISLLQWVWVESGKHPGGY